MNTAEILVEQLTQNIEKKPLGELAVCVAQLREQAMASGNIGNSQSLLGGAILELNQEISKRENAGKVDHHAIATSDQSKLAKLSDKKLIEAITADRAETERPELGEAFNDSSQADLLIERSRRRVSLNNTMDQLTRDSDTTDMFQSTLENYDRLTDLTTEEGES